MENASKALIMAGGMLLAILIVSLLIYAWDIFSKYQSSGDELIEIQDTAKFNSQFTQYDRDDVLGYEILSLINKVIDYNERKSADTVMGNNDKYPYISMSFKLVTDTVSEKDVMDKFTNDNVIRLFEKGGSVVKEYVEDELTVKNSGTRPSFKKNIEDKLSDIKKSLSGGEEISESSLTSLAKNIRSIFKTEDEIKNQANAPNSKKSEEDIKQEMVTQFNGCIGKTLLNFKDDDYKKLILNNDRKSTKFSIAPGQDYYKMACAYYEYMQFKKAVFKCTTLEYDDENSGRVKKIAFEFNGKIH